MDTLEIRSSTAFSEEQKQYLLGFFAGATQTGALPFVGRTQSGLITHDPAEGGANLAEAIEESVHGTPLSDLCREELWKHEQNPLDIWDRLVAHVDENRSPAADDLFRFKFHGLFYVAPALVTNIVGTNGVTNSIYTDEVAFDSAGMLNNLVLGKLGTFTGRLLLAGGAYNLTGSFDAFGHVTNHVVARSAQLGGPLILDMDLDTNSGVITT